MMPARAATAFAAALLLGTVALLPRAEAADSPTVVELYTSQGCYSCPPAERLLGELAKRPDVLALEFHVDYWDELVYGAAGKWRDPFSSPAHTDRQREYNLTIRGRGSVYTPQMVVDGRLEVVGARRGAVERTLRLAKRTVDPRIEVAIETRPDGGYTLTLANGPDTPGAVWLVSFRNAETTRVLRGENQGKTLVNHNVVTDMRRIGRWSGETGTIEIGPVASGPGAGCAVLVQTDGPGPILGAAACPMRGS